MAELKELYNHSNILSTLNHYNLQHMKKILSASLCLLIFITLHGQDVIQKLNGDVIKVKVTEIAKDSISYSLPGSTELPVKVAKSTLMKISFSNGIEMNFQEAPASDTLVFNDLYKQGAYDANKYYTGYRPAGTGTLITSIFFPLMGLIPAFSCSTTPPSTANLGIPNNSHSGNSDYQAGYRERARKIKSKKVWSNYAVGAGVGLAWRVAYMVAIISLVAVE
jgi:hypothetical protein